MAVSIIDVILGAVSDDNDLERARAAARRRLPALVRARRDRASFRLRDYLIRRGFSGAVVARIVRELTGSDVPLESDG